MDLTTPSDALLTRWREAAEPLPGHTDWTLSALTVDGAELGLVALRHGGASATLATLWIDPDHRRRGHGRDGLNLVEDHCRARGAEKLLTGTTPEAASRRLFADWEVTSRHMELAVGEEPVLPDGVVAKPMTAEVYATWKDHSVVEYGKDIARGSGVSLAEASREAREQFAQLLPQGIDTPDHELWTLHDDGAQVAILWVHIDRNRGVVFIYDVEADAAKRGKGYGRAATRLAESRALAAGLERVRLHVFAENVAANRLYESLGYQVTNENRRKVL